VVVKVGSLYVENGRRSAPGATAIAQYFFPEFGGIFAAEFEQAVWRYRPEHHARGFSSWTQMVAMLFCHLGSAQSLREFCGGLSACEGKLPATSEVVV